jgi:hypothetical protein
MPTQELVIRPVPSADAARWPRLVTLLAVALDRYLTQQPATVDFSARRSVYADVHRETSEVRR